jgi:hypothetical protein
MAEISIEPDPDTTVYAKPETVSVGPFDRVVAHQRASEVTALLLVAGVDVLAWTVDLDGEIHFLVRQGGDAERIYEVSGSVPALTSETAVFARFRGLEGQPP